MPRSIPERWIPYKACGDVIEGTRLICFKVPLNKNVQTDPEIKEIWDIPKVLAEIPNLCAVIDLTNTGRYYNPREFVAAGVKHKKIFMPGREIPSQEKVQEFMDAVDEFLGKDCDSLVGVHCTHGLNRTGYMVCRYMKERLNMSAEDAIKKFEKARGYEIEREIYLANLLGKTLPKSDLGKDTLVKPINKENDVKSPKHAYNRYEERNTPYERNNRHGSSRSNHKYGNRYNPVKNNRGRSQENGYLSWRKKDDESAHYNLRSRKNSRNYDTDSSNRSTPESTGYSYKHDY